MEKAIDEFLQIAGSSHGIILVASDGPDAPYLPIRALQSILNNRRETRPRLWLVTRGGQSVNGHETRVSVDQAAMWGTARVIAEEHPDLWGGLVDLDPAAPPLASVALLVRHILSRDGEDQVALRGERRFVLRLVSGHAERRPKAFQWRPDSAYLITGGLGDIGLLVARAMAAQGARRLVLDRPHAAAAASRMECDCSGKCDWSAHRRGPRTRSVGSGGANRCGRCQRRDAAFRVS